LCDYLSEEFVCLDLPAETKEEAIRHLAQMLKGNGNIIDFDGFLDDVFKREEQATTGIGNGVAIPHARTETVKDFVVAVGRAKNGIDFEAVDAKPVNLIILMGTPVAKVQSYLKLLAHLSLLLKGEGFVENLLAAPDAASIVELFRCREE